MPRLISWLTLFLLVLAFSSARTPAHAQGAALVGGTPTATHCAAWTNAYTIGDAGASCAGGGGSYGTIYDVVKTYGGDPTGAGDNTTAINAAITACGATGGVIWFQGGNYRVNSAITDANPCRFEGAGAGATNLDYYGTGSFLTFTGMASGASQLKITQNGSMVSGYAIAAEGAQGNYDHLFIDGAYGAILVSGAPQNLFDNLNILDVTGPVVVECDNSIGAVLGARFHQMQVNWTSGNTTSTSFVQGAACDSITLEVVSLNSGADCLDINAGSAFTFIVNLVCSGSQNGVRLNGGYDFQMTNSWVGGTVASSGIGIGPSFTGDVAITTSRIYGNGQHGILIAGGTDITITGNNIGQNSQTSVGVYDGIGISANVTNFTIVGNRIGAIAQGSPGTPSGTQAYCVIVQSGASDYYVIDGNNCQGNLSGAVSDGGSGSHKSIANNIGP